ncbi:MAG TPA: hypothetical protein VFM32_09420, partial [Spongiibacteraceae bacterium]|nr:hypothetical protein [Spongiibacteraceae bacterium]
TATDLNDKVAALSCADIYDEPECHGNVKFGITCIETHMSWIFLTPRFAYKLKKPVRSDYLDFSTLAAREHYCRIELQLNRRLAPSVYLDVVPLRRSRSGQLQIDGRRGEIVDYLVKMVRLPAERMLDRMLAARAVRSEHVRSVATTLAEFYRRGEVLAMTEAQYRARFRAAIHDNYMQLSKGHYSLPHERIARLVAAQLDYVETNSEFAARGTHVVDAHGDLRPEHIYLGGQNAGDTAMAGSLLGKSPQIIDCLEFESDFRKLDPIDEISFLALECTRLGSPQVGNALLRMYRILSVDLASPMLIAFYQSHRATVRAVLAIWHLDDPTVRDRERWHERALIYIGFAEHFIAKSQKRMPH